MSQNNPKKETADNPNRVRSLYLANTIFLCCLTLVSLAFALFVFFRLRTRGNDGYRQLYSQSQIENMKEAAAENERDALLLQIQSSLESGRSTTQMLREIFSDSVVVVSGGRYYFYPMADGVTRNVIEAGTLSQDGENVSYSGKLSSVRIEKGVLLSEDNGKVDWARFADSGVEEVALTAGRLTADGFRQDQQFERNRNGAGEKGLRYSLCLEVADPADRQTISEAVAALGLDPDADHRPDDLSEVKEKENTDKGREEGDGPETGETAAEASSQSAPEAAAAEEQIPAAGQEVILRLREAEEMSDDSGDRKAWTSAVKELCQQIRDAGGVPVIGGSLFTFAAQIDLEKLDSYDRWVIDHEENASFPYRFLFWEYSAEGHKEGVPGNSLLYGRIRLPAGVSVEPE